MNKRLLILIGALVVLFVGSHVLRTVCVGETGTAMAAADGHRMTDSANGSRSDTEIAPAYHRLVSLAPSITETLFAIGLGDSVVGVTRYCDYPKAATEKVKVGGYYDPNNEAIIALKPDLVIMFEEHEETRRVLERAQVDTLVVSHHSVSDILDTIEQIGNRMGPRSAAAKKADALAASLRDRVATIELDRQMGPAKSVMIFTGRNMGTGKIEDAYITGSDGFYNGLIQIVGARNAYQGDVAFPVVSNEGILRMNPDVIIDMVPDLEEQKLTMSKVLNEWRRLGELKAVQNNQVHILTDDYVVVPGPRFILLLEKLNDILNGGKHGASPGESK